MARLFLIQNSLIPLLGPAFHLGQGRIYFFLERTKTVPAHGVSLSMKDLLWQKRSAIVQRWFDLIVKTYPANSQNFIREQKDQFANPVGSTILRAIEGLYDELLRGMNFQQLTNFLDPVIRLRAVQDFSPSQAISFIPSLKKVIKKELAREIREMRLLEEWSEFESRIDQLTLMAFDIYMGCREQIYQIRLQEVRNRSTQVMERIRADGKQGEPPDLPADGENRGK